MRRGRGDARGGSTALEFALVGPLFLFILIGTFDLAILLFLTLTVENATWDAARYGATGWQEPPITREARIAAIVERETLGLLDDKNFRFESRVYDSFAEVATAEWLYDDEDAGGGGGGGGGGDDDDDDDDDVGDDDDGDDDDDDVGGGGGDAGHGVVAGFDDVNGDGVWNGDPGVLGAGGPNDVVVYRVTAEYMLITPVVSSVIGPVRIRSSAPLQNEPF